MKPRPRTNIPFSGKLILLGAAAASMAYAVRQRRWMSFTGKTVVITGASRGLGSRSKQKQRGASAFPAILSGGGHFAPLKKPSITRLNARAQQRAARCRRAHQNPL